jgi:hypothetical protein
MIKLRKFKIAIAAIQKTRWNKSIPQAFTSNGYNIYTSSLANNHEIGTVFLVDSKFRQTNGDQNYVLHAQTNPSPNLALPRWTQLQPDRSLLD